MPIQYFWISLLSSQTGPTDASVMYKVFKVKQYFRQHIIAHQYSDVVLCHQIDFNCSTSYVLISVSITCVACL
ncbi:hypothetical protein BJV82DRAFT_611965 [Fennellomyces sp. T-0311]|nr:hypothetical protein BJV82DRAFT_611965 [Fennellomyces sp. T-0311]